MTFSVSVVPITHSLVVLLLQGVRTLFVNRTSFMYTFSHALAYRREGIVGAISLVERK